MEDVREGWHKAPDTGPFFLEKERLREGDLAHSLEGTEDVLAVAWPRPLT